VRGPTYCDAIPAADIDTIMTLQRESIRWSVMIVSMSAAGIASQYVGPRTIGLVAGAFGSLTAVVWAWMDWRGRLPEPSAPPGTRFPGAPNPVETQ